MFRKLFLTLATTAGILASSPAVHADQEPYIGDVILTSFNFCPRGYASASGQMLPISQYQAVFALMGTTYGGDGRTTFALPNLNGRAPIQHGQAPGQINSYRWGQTAGSETTTATVANLPAHSHIVQASADNGNTGYFNNANFAQFPGFDGYVSNGTANGGSFRMDTISNTGGSQSMENRQPYLVMNWCVAIEGTFPSRS